MNKVKDIALVVTVGVLKRLQAESTVVKGQPFVVNLYKMGTSRTFAFYMVTTSSGSIFLSPL